MSTHLSSIRSAIKGKAPIVAIPVEGHAPACVDRKRLAAWSKAVDLRSATIETHYTFAGPQIDWQTQREWQKNHPGVAYKVEGPEHRLEGHRILVIEGVAGRVKTRCRMNVIDRRTAIKTLSTWSEKERAKLLKKTMLGCLAKEQKRAIKLAAHGDTEGAGAVTIISRHAGGVRTVSGIPVTLPGFEMTEFVIHRWDDLWVVTERYTGQSVGSGANGELALVDAREHIRKASVAVVASVIAQIEAAKLAQFEIAA